MKPWIKYSKVPSKTTEELEFEEFLDHNMAIVNLLRRNDIYTISQLKSYFQEHGNFLGIYGIGKTFDELIREIVYLKSPENESECSEDQKKDDFRRNRR